MTAFVPPHRHDPNPFPPSDDPTFTLEQPDGSAVRLTVADLRALPAVTVPNCYIVSTGHGTSGPFTFGGVLVRDLLAAYLPAEMPWSAVVVLSGDGFGTRLSAAEVQAEPVLLAYTVDGRPLTRREGLVRLIVPGETDDALKQVKWVERVMVITEFARDRAGP
ncbi:MAG: molybdopterin-dependent oxidoreductase [Caldilineales bacterium]|nr:molybdopterin-dependent oxidoreductase [Caldilineales bacterium]